MPAAARKGFAAAEKRLCGQGAGATAPQNLDGYTGLVLDASQIGTAAAFYVAGACVGALFFGQLTDRFGRKKLFLVTLGLYIVATVATGLSWTAWYFFASSAYAAGLSRI